MTANSELRVDLGAVEHNVRVVRGIVGPDCALCPILKADGYGLGVTPVARHLKAAGAGMLAVYSLEQAAQIARAAVGGPILVLMPVHEIPRNDETYRLLIQGRLHLALHDPGHLESLQRLADRFATPVPVHLEVDTGLSRGGCAPGEAKPMFERVVASRWLKLAGVWTHFASAARSAQATQRQMEVFDGLLESCGPLVPADCLIHVAATSAIVRHRRYHRSMVRFGLGWAGYAPDLVGAVQFRRQAAELRPILSWSSRIVQVKTIERGTRVGYGATWTARRRTTIGLIPVGYADGYPPALGATDERAGTASVAVHVPDGRAYVPVVGHVNMDQITVDLTDAVRKAPVEVGTAVEIIGTDPRAPNHLPALAKAAGTIPHEILSRLSPRLPRVYRSSQIVETKPAWRAVRARAMGQAQGAMGEAQGAMGQAQGAMGQAQGAMGQRS